MKVPLLILLATALLAACERPESAWDLAQREDTEAAYLEFMARFPDSPLAQKARERMTDLKAIRAWERAEFKDTIDYYQRFIDAWPDDKNAAAARSRIAELKRDEAWQKALDEDSVDAYDDFIARFPDGPQLSEARTRRDELAAQQEIPAPTERAGEYRLQLAVFRTAASAETEVRRLSRLFPESFRGPIRIEPVESSGRFRLVTVPMNDTEAAETCDALKRSGQDCLIVNR